MSKQAHSGNADMDAIERQGRKHDEQESRQKQKPTPTPWRYGVYDGEPDIIEIWASEKTAKGSDKFEIARVNLWNDAPGEAIANAAFICNAVNNHESLLEACKAQHKAIDKLLAMLIERDRAFRPSKSGIWPLLVQGNDAITKAERK